MIKQLSDETISDDQKMSMWVGTFCPLEVLLARFTKQDEVKKEDYLEILQHLVCSAEITKSNG